VNTPYKWLDVCAFSEAALKNTDCEIDAVKYFTARVFNTPLDPDQRDRQNNHLLALQTLPNFELYEGRYLSHVKRSQVAPPDWTQLPKKVRRPAPWEKPEQLNVDLWQERGKWPPGEGPKINIIHNEEKGSDVNIGVHMLNDAWLGDIECAVLISNDSDLAEACRLVRLRGVKIGLITKAQRPTDRLSRNADFHRHIMTGHLKGSQLPGKVIRKNGQELSRPASW